MPGGSVPPQHQQNLWMKNRERTWSVTVSPEMLAVNTSDYLDFPSFESVVEKALRVTFRGESIPVNRIGIRYVDEIRVPGIDRPHEWDPYLDGRLLGSVAFAEGQKSSLPRILGLTTGPERHLMLRYGPPRSLR